MVIVELSEKLSGRGADPVRLEVDAAIVYTDCVTDYQGHRLATKDEDGHWVRSDWRRQVGCYRHLRIDTNGKG